MAENTTNQESQQDVEIRCVYCDEVITTLTQKEADDIDLYGVMERSHFHPIELYIPKVHQEVIVYQGDVWCEDCRYNRFEHCAECGAIIDKQRDDYYEDNCTGDCYCESCRDELFFYCDECNEYFDKRDHNYNEVLDCHGNTHTLCDDCTNEYAFYCVECQTYYLERSVNWYETSDGDRICESCFDNGDHGVCANCGYVFPSEQLVSRRGENYCRECYADNFDDEYDPSDECNDRVIFGYHQYPNNWAFRNDATPQEAMDYLATLKKRHKVPHFGIELEIDKGGESNNKAIKITTALGFPANTSSEFKCSRDGSLDDGFEIISMPATLPYHLNTYKWEAGMQEAVRLGYGSHDPNTCGLHFHVDREYFKDSFVNPEEGYVIITTNNIGWLKGFSRRTQFAYCRFADTAPFKVEDFKSENQGLCQHKLDNLRNLYRGHGSALNFANNATIELRFIRGTLKYTTFVAALQLMEMMAYAVKHFRKEQLVSVTLRWFTKFAERKGFNEFLSYIQARGIIVK